MAFKGSSWLFPWPTGHSRQFRYRLDMSPDRAQEIKADLKLLLLCHLAEPWIRDSAHGHDPTMDAPYKTLVGEHYLEIVPKELWLFNSRTGEVIVKLESSLGEVPGPRSNATTPKGQAATDNELRK